MYRILKNVRDSHTARICLLLAFFVIATLIFVSRSGEQIEPRSNKLLSRQPGLANEMSSNDDETIPGEVMTGGLSSVREKDDEVNEVVNQIKPVLEERSSKKFESLEVIHYRPQTVAGKNYFVKAKAKEVGGQELFVHLRIYRNLQRKVELTAFQIDKKLEDKLEYFQ